MARDTEKLAAGLRAWLPRGERITGVKTLSAGHSNETYLVEGTNEILRMPPSEEGLLPPYDMVRQHAVLSAVAANAPEVPLPPVLELCDDPRVLGDPFFLMGCIKGEAFEYSVPEWLAADPDAGADHVCRQWFDAIIALHNMPASAMPPGARTVQQEAQHWLEVARGADSVPPLISVLEDLAARPPRTSGAPTPVHGDPKHGNCLWHEGQLTGLLDWEMAQVSEPLLDLGYVLMFHDQGEASLANAGFELPGWWSPQRMIDEWEAGTGRTAVDVARYGVLGQAKVAAIISVGAFLFNSGRIADPRFQAFGALIPSYTALLERRAMAAG
ncbi:phosphotransferase family protein [Novosphingobium sp. 9U]|uniref:phosphotransferase family protein n=1 Tax=Novosphingobium sp. 9U TaxID=2653158 RepID=UPI0012F0D1AB|nr:phosphotransferase family protein [Novosphingobium sp. 9U]VWX47307.1 Aminoglycoside phosphotransferase [Novosphingobium sp. 9U]